MPETVSVREDLGIIVIRSCGEVTELDIAKSREQVVKILHERNFRKILVDAREATSMPSTMQIFDFGISISGSDILRMSKHAVVLSQDTKEDLGFLETVLQNRGVQLRLFTSLDSATAWLARQSVSRKT